MMLHRNNHNEPAGRNGRNLHGGRAGTVARWFGLPLIPPRRTAEQGPRLPLPGAGRIVLISGPSGSGKSSLLRQYRRRLPTGRWIDLNRIPLPHRPVIELFPGLPLEKALELLSRVGLAEAHTYLLPPAKLSAGQRWRLRVALAIARPEMAVARHWAVGTGHCFCLVCDEFAAVLDRVTAAIVAHALRRVVDQGSGLCAILATSHDDVVRGLRPDWVVECEFGKVEVRRMRGNGGEGVCEGETKARPPRPMRF